MIAITGTSGLLGGNLVRELLGQGKRVRALVHKDDRAIRGLDVERMETDIEDPALLERAFEGAEVVYHLASLISLSMDDWDRIYRSNVIGTRNVVEACLRSGVKRLVYFGSAHSRQPKPFGQPLTEERPLVTDPKAPPYDRSKALGEMEIEKGIERGLDAIVMLPTALLGPYDYRPSFVGQGLQLLASGKLPALTEGGYDWVDARDVARAAMQAAERAPCGSRYILSGHWKSIAEVAQMASQITGGRVPKLAVPLWLADLGSSIMGNVAMLSGSQPLYTRAMLSALRSNHQVSHEQASRDLGFAPRPFEETLRDTLEWFRGQGMI